MKTYIGKRMNEAADLSRQISSKTGMQTRAQENLLDALTGVPAEQTGARTTIETFESGAKRSTLTDAQGNVRDVSIELPGEGPGRARVSDNNNDGIVDSFSSGISGQNAFFACDSNHDGRIDFLSFQEPLPQGQFLQRDLIDGNHDGEFEREYRWTKNRNGLSIAGEWREVRLVPSNFTDD